MSRADLTSMRQANVISVIFITRHHSASEGSGYIENGKVTHIHAVKATRVAVSAVQGSARGSRVNNMLNMVASAMIIAYGKVVAKPQPWVCGFITLIQTHIRIPLTGLRSTHGNAPNTIRVTRMSRTVGTP